MFLFGHYHYDSTNSVVNDSLCRYNVNRKRIRMMKNIILTIVALVLVCSAIINVVQYKTIKSQHETIKEQCETIVYYKDYYNAAEDLLTSIEDGNGLGPTGINMCGDIPANYLVARSKLNSKGVKVTKAQPQKGR